MQSPFRFLSYIHLRNFFTVRSSGCQLAMYNECSHFVPLLCNRDRKKRVLSSTRHLLNIPRCVFSSPLVQDETRGGWHVVIEMNRSSTSYVAYISIGQSNITLPMRTSVILSLNDVSERRFNCCLDSWIVKPHYRSSSSSSLFRSSKESDNQLKRQEFWNGTLVEDYNFLMSEELICRCKVCSSSNLPTLVKFLLSRILSVNLSPRWTIYLFITSLTMNSKSSTEN